MSSTTKNPESLRDRKREQTLERIAATGLKLFIEHGYEATTLDMIAAEAGVSRGTFFNYFKSKEDILLAHHGNGVAEAMRPAILAQSPDQAPLDVVRKCLLELASRYETEQSIITDRLFRSTEALRLRKEATFVEVEQVMFDALCELWPDPARRDSLRMVAMMAMGTLRLSQESWRAEDGRHPLPYHIDRGFAVLKGQF